MRTLRVLLAVLFLTSSAFADEIVWEGAGPSGGLVLGIQVGSGRVLVQTSRAYFLSDDDGRTWTRVLRPGALAAGPVALCGRRLWCEDEDVVWSSEDGMAWGPEGSVPGRVLAFTRTSPPWALAFTRPADDRVALHLLARQEKDWRNAKTVTAKASPDAYVNGFFLTHPSAPGVLRAFVVGLDRSDSTFAIGSDDRGKTWEAWHVEHRLFAVVPYPGRHGSFGAACQCPPFPPSGFARSDDGGHAFVLHRPDARLMGVRSLAGRADGSWLFGTNEDGLLEASPDLSTLTPLNEGLPAPTISALALDPDTPQRVWAGLRCGLFVSEDGGRGFTWRAEGIEACQLLGLAAPRENEVLAFEFHQGIRTSRDGGRTWSPMDPTWRRRLGKIYQVVGKGRTVAACVGAGDFDWRVTLTRDGGRTWSTRSFFHNVWVVGASGDDVYVASDGRRLLRSVEGNTFLPFGAGLPAAVGEIVRVLPTSDGESLVIVGERGIARCSRRTGEDVVLLDPPPGGAYAAGSATLAADDVLYVWTRRGTLCRRPWPAGNWEKILENPAGILVGLVSDPGRQDRRVAAFSDGRLEVSEDGGRTWKALPGPGRCSRMLGIVAGPDRRLYLAVNGGVRSLMLSSLD